MQKLGFPAKFLDFKIQNMVGSCDVKFPIRLEGLVLTHQQFSRCVGVRRLHGRGAAAADEFAAGASSWGWVEWI